MNWKILLIGLTLLGLSAFVQAAYNPYANFGYARPAYSQFYAYPGISRAAEVYYGSYGVYSGSYSPYYYYRSPAAFVAPTYTVYTPPVIPVYQTAYYPVQTYRVVNQPVYQFNFGSDHEYEYEYEYEYESDGYEYEVEYEFEG